MDNPNIPSIPEVLNMTRERLTKLLEPEEGEREHLNKAVLEILKSGAKFPSSEEVFNILYNFKPVKPTTGCSQTTAGAISAVSLGLGALYKMALANERM